MHREPLNPFDSIESAHDFVDVLAQSVTETKLEIQQDLQRDDNSNLKRRRDALVLACYKLEKLEVHMSNSRRILNDLRTLRRLLFDERQAKVQVTSPQPKAAVPQPEPKPSTEPSSPDVIVPKYEKPVLANVASFRVRPRPTTAA